MLWVTSCEQYGLLGLSVGHIICIFLFEIDHFLFEFINAYTHIYIHTCIYIYIYIYIEIISFAFFL